MHELVTEIEQRGGEASWRVAAVGALGGGTPLAATRLSVAHISRHPHSPACQVLFTVGKPCNSCERGALASRAFAPGELIARIPAGSTLAVGPGPLPDEALKLLTKLHTDPPLNKTFSAFLDSLPGLSDMLAPASLAPAALAELQLPELVSVCGGEE